MQALRASANISPIQDTVTSVTSENFPSNKLFNLVLVSDAAHKTINVASIASGVLIPIYENGYRASA